jgi:C-terminal processing protease CtpA/Prc
MQQEITVDAAKADLKTFSDILKKAHPSLNLYISAERFNTLIDSLNKSITETISLNDLYNKLIFIVDEIGCSHTGVQIPDYVYDTLDHRNYFFPYPVAFIDGKLLVNEEGLDLPQGTEITAINKEPVEDILHNIMRYNPVEGRHRSIQIEMAASQFEMQYYLSHGKKERFTIKTIDTNGISKTVYKDAVNYEKVVDHSNNIYYFDAVDADYNCYFSKEKDYAYLRIATFAFNRTQQQDAFENFCNNTFELLKYKHPANLIIDLRQNSGGKLYNAFFLYSFFAKKPFREYDKVYSKIKAVPFKECYSDNFWASDEQSINDYLTNEFKQRTTDHYYAIPDSLISTWDPDVNHFNGKVYVVVNCETASSASYFATMIKNSGVGKIVGENACGGSYSGNGYQTLRYTLPQSHIKFYFPYAHMLYTFKDEKNTAMGLMPDYVVPNTYESFKNNSDKQLWFIVDSLVSK